MLSNNLSSLSSSNAILCNAFDSVRRFAESGAGTGLAGLASPNLNTCKLEKLPVVTVAQAAVIEIVPGVSTWNTLLTMLDVLDAAEVAACFCVTVEGSVKEAVAIVAPDIMKTT